MQTRQMTVNGDNWNIKAPPAERRRHPRNEFPTRAAVREVDAGAGRSRPRAT